MEARGEARDTTVVAEARAVHHRLLEEVDGVLLVEAEAGVDGGEVTPATAAAVEVPAESEVAEVAEGAEVGGDEQNVDTLCTQFYRCSRHTAGVGGEGRQGSLRMRTQALGARPEMQVVDGGRLEQDKAFGGLQSRHKILDATAKMVDVE